MAVNINPDFNKQFNSFNTLYAQELNTVVANTVTNKEDIQIINDKIAKIFNEEKELILKPEDIGALPNTITIPSIEGLATEQYVKDQINILVGAADGALDTLEELANALGNDEQFSVTVTNLIGEKVSKDTKINDKALNSDIRLYPEDIGSVKSEWGSASGNKILFTDSTGKVTTQSIKELKLITNDFGTGDTTTFLNVNNGEIFAKTITPELIGALSPQNVTYTAVGAYTISVGTLKVGDTEYTIKVPKNTHYISKNVVNNSASAIVDSTAALENGSVFLNSVENSQAESSHLIKGEGYTTVSYNGAGSILINTSVPTATDVTKGIARLYQAADCSSYTSEDGAVTPAAAKKAVSTFIISSNTNGSISVVGNNVKVYTHPAGSSPNKADGLYKFSTDATSHIKTITAVTKDDITSLGIPAQDTVYNLATETNEGLMSSEDKIKINSVQPNANYTLLGKGFIGLLDRDTGATTWDLKLDSNSGLYFSEAGLFTTLSIDTTKIATVEALNKKVSLPDTNGTAGQFAISDGNGGITWQSIELASSLTY